jgi:3',5'-nucleoside bisphosphate phosphatase
MVKAYYDLHIHSCLSPCSDNDMTPNNIINMAKLKGLDMISITDHNSMHNLESFEAIARRSGILLVPGIEVQTIEDVHLLCYFRNIDDAKEFHYFVKTKKSNYSKVAKSYGMQLLADENDEILGQLMGTLSLPLNVTVAEVSKVVRELKGAMVPAHIDRMVNSIVGSLGFIPKDLPISTVEVMSRDSSDAERYSGEYNLILNSDAHSLGAISERKNYLELEDMSVECLIDRIGFL